MTQRIRLALVSFWLGAMALFTTSVARAAFAVLPTRRMAGDLVSPILADLEYFGLAMSAILMALLLLSGEVKRTRYYVELIVYLLALIGTATARFVVAAKIHDIRANFGDKLDTLALTDPTKVLFGQLHGLSVGLTGLNIIFALVVVVVLVRAPRTVMVTEKNI
jgi:Domain of unknown function (DUF4149)